MCVCVCVGVGVGVGALGVGVRGVRWCYEGLGLVTAPPHTNTQCTSAHTPKFPRISWSRLVISLKIVCSVSSIFINVLV